MAPLPLKLHRNRGLLDEERGATAVEFALILVPLILLTLGTINLSLMIYTVSALQSATQDAARCATVRPTVCTATGTPSGVQTYGAGAYGGLTASPTFTATSATCGSKVVGTATYNFATGVTTTPISLSATACYPLS